MAALTEPSAHHGIFREAIGLNGEWLALSRAHNTHNLQEQRDLRQRVLKLTSAGFRTAPWTQARDILLELRVDNSEFVSLVRDADTQDDVRRQEFLMPFLKRAVLLLSAYDFVMRATLNMTFTKDEFIELMDDVDAAPTNDSIAFIAERQEKLAIMLAILSHSKYAGLVPGLMKKYDISREVIQEYESRPYYEGLWQNTQTNSQAA